MPTSQQGAIDLYCTLTETIGGRLWPKSPFTLQVKSNMAPWEFHGIESVQWLVQHPLPLFLCVVRRNRARMSVYHTTHRIWAWARGGTQELLRLTPTNKKEGGRISWPPGETNVSLDAPILDFTASDLMDNTFQRQARSVLENWVAIENANLTRLRTGVPRFVMPAKYLPNQPPPPGLTATYSKTKEMASDEQFEAALPFLKESLDFVLGELHKRGDVEGAAKAVMLRRHGFLFGGTIPFLNEIDDSLALVPDKYRHVGVEHLEQIVHNTVEESRMSRLKEGPT